MILAISILAFVTLQRLVELWIAQRNTSRLMSRGAKEYAPGHYPFIVALHTAWLLGLWVIILLQSLEPDLIWIFLFLILQALRCWVLVSLGERWTTRIIVLPGTQRIRGGPFRFVDHPNYMIVAAEIAVLPIAFGLYWYAIGFSIANAILLAIRIRHEEAALDAAEQAIAPAGSEQVRSGTV